MGRKQTGGDKRLFADEEERRGIGGYGEGRGVLLRVRLHDSRWARSGSAPATRECRGSCPSCREWTLRAARRL